MERGGQWMLYTDDDGSYEFFISVSDQVVQTAVQKKNP